MTNETDGSTGISRRSALKKIGGTAGGGALVGFATGPATAAHPKVHRKWARQAAKQVKDDSGNSNILVDDIAREADEPDENPYKCPDSYPWYVCAWLDDVNQPYTHYNNPEETTGKAPQKAKKKAKQARDEATDWNTNWTYVAELTGRCLHYIQDAATLVHTGREYEQHQDNNIHWSYESWVKNNWDSDFHDAVVDAKSQYDGIQSGSDVKSYTLINNEKAYDKLNNNWSDIESYGNGYGQSTYDATYDSIEDATRTIHGVIDWIYNE